MADLWVGESRDFTTLGAAVSAASDGDTIYIDAGVYENDFVNIRKEVSLIGVGGMAHFTATEQIGNGKAIIIANASLTIENLEFSGASVADGNGAGIRYHNGTLVVRDSSFHDNENGILAGTPGDGRIEIHNSSFVGNGIGDGKTHGIYAGDISTFIVRDSYFEATYKGSHIKSRADTTEITGNRLIDGDGQSNYGIDISNAGDATITGNWFEQAADTSNRTMINYGSEGDKPGVLTVVGNTMINFRPLATGVKNRVDNDAVVEDNTFVDVSLWIDGQATASGNVDAELADVLANLAPLGGDDTASTAAGAAVDLAVLDNDSDGDGGTLTLAAIGAAGNGDVADNGDGTLTYTPDAGFVGDDSFDYWVVDQQGGVDRATVTVTVSVAEPPAGPAPVLFDAAGFSSYSSGQDAVGGQTILDGGTTVQFVGNTWRKFAYDYAITDDTVLAFEFRSTIEGEIHGIDLDSDNVWGRETFQVYGTQTNNWQGNPDLYTGAGNWQSFEIDAGDLFGLGDIHFIAFVNDHDGGARNAESAYRNVTLYEAGATPLPNLDPDAVDDLAATAFGVAVDIDVLANDSDPENDPLTVAAVGAAGNGSVADNGDGTLTYTPDAGFFGDDSFTYTVDDGQGGSDTATVTVSVAAPNLDPDAVDDLAATGFGVAVDIDVLANDSDPENDPLTVAAVGAAANGSVADNGNGTLTYTPNAGFSGDDSFTYTIDDGQGGSDTATVTVSVAEPPAGPAPVLFDAAGFSSYSSGQDAVGGQTILDGGTTVQFAGNTWRKFDYDYAITDDTVLAFEFRSTIEGEIHGIDLDSDNVWGRETFQVYGTQTNNWQGNPDLYTGAGNWQSFEIDAGDLFGLGDIHFIAFLNDHDGGARDAESAYRNVTLYEADVAIG